MNNFFTNIRFHWVAIFFSVFFGLLVSSPNILSIHSFTDFKGIYQTFNDEEVYYQGRVSEIVRGNWFVSNVYIKEHKNDLFLVPPVAEWIIALTVILFGFSVPFTMVINDIFFTAISFLLFYSLLIKILDSKLHSLFYSSFFYILFIHILGRPVNPQLTNIFLFLGLFLVYKIYYKEGRINVLNFIFGVVFGLSLFISPYYGSALFLLYFLLNILVPFFKEGFIKTIKSIKYFLLSSLPFILGYGFIMNKVSELPNYADSSIRFGLINTHYFGSYSNITIATLCLILFYINRRYIENKEKWFLLSLVISIFILNWQNIITGQLIQFASHYYIITVIYAFLFVAVIHSLIIKNSSAYFDTKKNITSIFVVLLLFSFIFYKQYREVLALWDRVTNKEQFLKLQEKRDVFDWMNINTPKDSVVYTLGGNYDDLIPIYTHNKVYYNFYATLSVMSNDETENRWLNQELFNPNVTEGYILDNQREFWCNTYLDKYNFDENRKKIISLLTFSKYLPSKQFDDLIIKDLYDNYIIKLKSDPIFIIKEYETDYILVSPEYEFYDDAVSKLNKIESIEKVANINSVYIYKI